MSQSIGPSLTDHQDLVTYGDTLNAPLGTRGFSTGIAGATTSFGVTATGVTHSMDGTGIASEAEALSADLSPEQVSERFLAFLEDFGRQLVQTELEDGQVIEEETPSAAFQALLALKSSDKSTMWLSVKDVSAHDPALSVAITTRYARLEATLRKALFLFILRHEPGMVKGENERREYFVAFYDAEIERMRDLRTGKLGQLVSFVGTVTRTSDVKPELAFGAFKCLQCGATVRGVEQQFKYSPPVCCSNPTCGNRSDWSLVREESLFYEWQRLRVQEAVEEVPAGSLPRTLDVILRNEAVELAKAGDRMLFTGRLAVAPDVSAVRAPGESAVSMRPARPPEGVEGVLGVRAAGSRELSYRLVFIASACQVAQVSRGMINIRPDVEERTADILAEYGDGGAFLRRMAEDPQVYRRLAKSLCPAVFGHEDIKQAVLLMLMGGVHKTTPEGIELRGDINVAIVGDPSCAKSQILKYVAGFLPRAVYTSGKASSAAGLTASVVREPENNEFAIEAGALMLADNGVCCIDEFDKMDLKDQVAIHEAMEQQTISIAKAGIRATLNARASILAAANPVGGRYDRSKPMKYNVALPPAILSRFDLLHVMIDDTTEAMDLRIANHILSVHRLGVAAFAADREAVPYTTEEIQHYIRLARSIKPRITTESARELVRSYRELRLEDQAPGASSSHRITVRQLEALIRLSEAMARVYCAERISPAHVHEARRLLRASILKIELMDVELDDSVAPAAAFADAGSGLRLREGAQDGGGEEEEAPGGEGPTDGSAAAKRRLPGAYGDDVDESGAADGPAAKRSRTHPSAISSAAAEVGAASPNAVAADAIAAEAVAPVAQVRAPTKISAQKFALIKSFLAQRIGEVMESELRGIRALAPGEAPPESASTEEGIVAESGVRQGELVRQYLEHQASLGLVHSAAEQEREFDLAHKVVNHLVKRGEMLAVLLRPARRDDEGEAEYLQRLQDERILTWHSTYVPEDA